MSTSTTPRKRKQPERRVRLVRPLADGCEGAIRISVGGERHSYAIFPLASDFGAAFRLVKEELVLQPEGFYELKETARYSVCLDGERSSCECKGFLRWGRCKHLSGLLALRRRGLI